MTYFKNIAIILLFFGLSSFASTEQGAGSYNSLRITTDMKSLCFQDLYNMTPYLDNGATINNQSYMKSIYIFADNRPPKTLEKEYTHWTQKEWTVFLDSCKNCMDVYDNIVHARKWLVSISGKNRHSL